MAEQTLSNRGAILSFQVLLVKLLIITRINAYRMFRLKLPYRQSTSQVLTCECGLACLMQIITQTLRVLNEHSLS